MITVIGEALVDLLVSLGPIEAHLGGGPYNTARTIGRLGVPVTFAGRLASDTFGDMLREGLASSGVSLPDAEPSALPTTLGVGQLSSTGSASYRFYLAGTSVGDLEYRDLAAAVTDPVSAVYIGGLGLVAEPAATSTATLVACGLPASALVMLDPNCRPAAISSRPEYLARLMRLAGRADIVKASVEDLAYMSPFPDQPAEAAAAGLLAAGAGLVLVTDGPHPARAFLSDGSSISVAVPSVAVVDTVGAGDAFGGAFLAWWARCGLGRSALGSAGLVEEAVRFAVKVSALTCTRPGADPPRIAEIPGKPFSPLSGSYVGPVLATACQFDFFG